MTKRIPALLLAFCLLLSLAACGSEAAQPSAEPTPEPTPSAPALPAGSYSFSEAAMGGAFTVEWELELREDGTYTIIEHNPFMGDLSYEGEYTVDADGVVTTLPFEGEPPMAEFFEADKSCKWTLDGENCKPVNYVESGDAPAEEGGLAGIKYAANSEAQVLDIHLPEGEGPFPVIVLVHGGGFLFGDQAMPIIQPVIDAGTAAGWAVVSVDYRKSGEAAFPAALVDLKTALRFLRHHRAQLPGDWERVVSAGWSAGGAMSTLLAVSGDNAVFDAYLKENGAYMDESDAVWAAQIYCPIVDLQHADMAYEWFFHADKTCEDSPAGPAETMTPFKEALSALLAKRYAEYFSSLGLRAPGSGDTLSIEDGRGGSAPACTSGRSASASSW